MGQVLSVSELEKTFELRKTVFSVRKHIIRAIDKVSFDLEEGDTLGVVGESGSGKSTLARCLLLLDKPDGGVIRFRGQDLSSMSEGELRNIRKDLQIVFQDPYASLNPRKNIFGAIAEPLVFHKIASKRQLKEKVVEILKSVGLNEDFLYKYPHEMSGGQRQRVAIGRALSTSPLLLVADEPVSSLDVSIQAQIINLFIQIKEQLRISMIFVSHDLNIVQFISDKIMVIYGGRIVEMGGKDEVFQNPLHPYTKMLITALGGVLSVPQVEDQGVREDGCPYYARCEERELRCSRQTPDLAGPLNHKIACFRSMH